MIIIVGVDMISQHCLVCSSLNNIHEELDSQAFECWNCKQAWWLDDQARLEYMVFNDVDTLQAETDLSKSDSKIMFATSTGEV